MQNALVSFTHLDGEGAARMVDVSAKPVTAREASAAGLVRSAPSTRELLKKLYTSGITQQQMRERKAALFAQLTSQARELQHKVGHQYYESWLKEGLNNAHLASIATYYQCVPGFERLLAAQNGDLQRFYAAARELSRKPHAERHAQ